MTRTTQRVWHWLEIALLVAALAALPLASAAA